VQNSFRLGPDECSFDGIHISEIPAVQRSLRCGEARGLGWDLPDKPMDLVTFARQLLRYVASNESRDASYQNAVHRFVS
jgi:hypothetical protein